MACSVPVVATSIGVNKIIIEHNYNGLLVENNDEWIDNILKLKNESNLYNMISNNGYQTVKEKFDIMKWKIKYLDKINLIFSKKIF